jgi:hypothetical protein
MGAQKTMRREINRYVLRIERGALGSDNDKCLRELEIGKVTTILGQLE